MPESSSSSSSSNQQELISRLLSSIAGCDVTLLDQNLNSLDLASVGGKLLYTAIMASNVPAANSLIGRGVKLSQVSIGFSPFYSPFGMLGKIVFPQHQEMYDLIVKQAELENNQGIINLIGPKQFDPAYDDACKSQKDM